MADALILSGGVAKGAFGAGALSVLADSAELDVRRIVATSSGALNGVFLAAALRRGDERAAASALADLWIEHGSVGEVFDLNLSGVTALTGLSTDGKVMDLLRRYVRPSTGGRFIELHLVVTATSGVPDQRAPGATTFEQILAFDGAAFDKGPRFDAMLAAVTASAAFPFVFLPVSLMIDGQHVECYDGGLVDSAPVGRALGDPAVDRLFVILPYPHVFEGRSGDTHGLGLLAHLGDVIISERLHRELRRARAVNESLGRLEARLDADALDTVREALGWRGRRPIEIVELRPPALLEGNAFDGFFSRRLREDYVRAGKESARAWVRARGVPGETALSVHGGSG